MSHFVGSFPLILSTHAEQSNSLYYILSCTSAVCVCGHYRRQICLWCSGVMCCFSRKLINFSVCSLSIYCTQKNSNLECQMTSANPKWVYFSLQIGLGSLWVPVKGLCVHVKTTQRPADYSFSGVGFIPLKYWENSFKIWYKHVHTPQRSCRVQVELTIQYANADCPIIALETRTRHHLPNFGFHQVLKPCLWGQNQKYESKCVCQF